MEETSMSSQIEKTELYMKLLELDVALRKKADEKHIEKIIQNIFHIETLGGNDTTALHVAQHERWIEVSKLLLLHGADFTLKNSLGSTAIHAAIERAYEHETYTTFPFLKSTRDFAGLILSAHIQSESFNNPCNKNGISHFHAACTVNNVEAVRFFLDSGVSVDQAIDANSSILPGYTALHIAVKYYNMEVVSVLLHYNADVHAKNAEGMTPVHVCVQQKMKIFHNMQQNSQSINELGENRLQIIDTILLLLLQNYSAIDSIGLSHLHVSCIMADSSIAEHLLEQNVNIDHSLNTDSPIFAGYTAVHFASHFNIDTVKLLVTKGANMQLENSDGLSQLDLCIQKYQVEVLHSVLSCHPLWKNILLTDTKTKLMDLIYALRDLDQFKSFIENVLLSVNKPLIPNSSPLWPGFTLLHLVIAVSNKKDRYFYTSLIEECLKKGADPTTPDSFGSTPLHLAVLKDGHVYGKVFTSLWGYCKNIVNPVDKNNLSHLHILCSSRYGQWKYLYTRRNDPNLIRKLLTKDKLSKVNSHIAYEGRTVKGIVSGSTPLHLAITDVEKTRILMKHGADIHAVDAEGFTPIHRLIMSDSCKEVAAIVLSSPDLKDCVVSSIGLSHLHVAARADAVESLEKMLDRGADIDARISQELPDELWFFKDYAGSTALQIAVARDGKRAVEFLLRHGADMFTKKSADDISLIYKILSSFRSKHLAAFADTLQNNYVLQKRFNEETGLTMFHVACHKLDINLMKRYLAGTSMNVQAREDSPIWSGFTALHIVKDRMRLLFWDEECDEDSAENRRINNNVVDGVLKFLLSNGADVMIADTNKNTPLHVFFQKMVTGCKRSYARVKSILKGQTDFSLNPTDSAGTSHFHIACAMNNFVAVQQFLKHGVDVGKPNNQGDTPLHFSAGSAVTEFSGSMAQRKTIQLLLKHGAEINAKNICGNTPLHEAAAGRSNVDIKIFKRIFKAGADLGVVNVSGETPLELLCKSDTSSAKHFKLFTKRGCQLNAFSLKSDKGFIGLILNTENPNKDSIWKLVLSLPEAKEVDKMGHSAIHNAVSSPRAWNQVNEYKKIVEDLVNIGCDIDSQDIKGETALHKAAKFRNEQAVFALIKAGADFNLVDKNGKTALAYSILIGNSYKFLLRQVIIFQLFNLHICQINKDILQKSSYSGDIQDLLKELDKAKNVKIGDSLTLRRFLSEATISAYAYMSLTNRSAIRAFVEFIDYSEFKELKPVIRMMFRKAEKRISLLEDATACLRSMSNFSVPDVCCRIIFQGLNNTDLKNLSIAAFEGFEDV